MGIRDSAAILATKRSAYVAPEVNQRNQTLKLGDHPGRRHQKAKTLSPIGPTKWITALQIVFEKSQSRHQPQRQFHTPSHRLILCSLVHQNWDVLQPATVAKILQQPQPRYIP